MPAGLSNVVAVAAGGLDSLALRNDGTVVAWGALSYVPPHATNVVAIAAGFAFDAALRADGTIVAWGQLTPPTGLGVTLTCGGH